MIGINWAEVCKCTKSGTILVRLTLDQLRFDFEEWCFGQRTGVDMGRGKRLWLANWKSIVEKEAGMSLDEIDVAKVMSIVEEDFLKWQKSGAGKPTSMIAALPPGEVVEVSKHLHEIYKSFGVNRLDLNALAAYFMARGHGEEGEDFESIKGRIKAACRAPMSHDVWSVGQGPSPTIARLRDAKGKATGEEPLPQTRARKGSKNAPEGEEEEEEEGRGMRRPGR